MKKGGRGDLLSTLADHPQDHLQHGGRFQQHLPIIEPEDAQTLARQECITPSIACQTVGGEMLAAVQFDYQIGGRTMEIDDVSPEWFLSIELHAIELLPAQVKPEPMFGIGHVTAQPACMGFQISRVGKHPESESPLPPFSKGGKGSIPRRESPLQPTNRSGIRTRQLHGTATEEIPSLKGTASKGIPSLKGTAPEGIPSLKGTAPEGIPPLKKGGRADLLLPGRTA